MSRKSSIGQSLEIFREIKNPRLIANPLYDLSLMSQNGGKLDLAHSQMEEVMALYVQIGYKSGIAAALLNLGLIEDQIGDFTRARDFFRRSRNIAEELGEQLGVGYAKFRQGASAYKEGELSQAIVYLEDAHKIFVKLQVDSYNGYTLSYMTSVLVRLESGDEAVSRAMEQIQIIKNTGEDVEKGRIFLALAGLVERKISLSTKARKQLKEIMTAVNLDKVTPARFYRKALETSRDAHYVNTWISTLFHFGDYLLSIGKMDTGHRYIRKARDESEISGWKNFVRILERKYPEITIQNA
ncbi:MAG: tetratricopeptide repeat protein [Spirochaetaceae bacterium]|nr:tetratricopeptide repeat protein [Spirochaetaceae bacterium]